ncbi:heme lyase CcmF/NrfE family subunit [Sandarakinorhabdus oryzae]|uniref:heme lyase CcmF/NrfE family subunit n=1 Tax=Sandarakinorhabdus oryzae TaxID=2675220 RepID=UPI0012E10A61|nr:heme lyase CcmF/NrfE family subunit [Sandarakinorhabdus oryzae]
MIAELGLAALWLGAALALLQLALGALALGTRHAGLQPALPAVAVAQAVLTGIAFLCLVALFMRSDMSVLLVATNSHSAKPMLYKFAGTWGNHEGSMLLWVSILAAGGALVALLERRLPMRTKTATLAAQAAIAIGFYAFLLFSSNPFARLNPAAPDGQGLNPLLQDPGLAFHPPTLYLGYVGMSVAFSFAVGALVTRDVGPGLARAMRPWVLGAWIFLTLGISAGSYWAYYELGWGGWWFWDPVENASLMPWLAATALLHSVTVLATRNGLPAWTIMLSVVAFSMSMVGTFLVRSGILTSVHSFAVDPTRGAFILGLLAVYIGGAMALFALRIGTVQSGSPFEPVSREGALVLNNLLLSGILVVVLVGTLYPLALEAANGTRLSVGAPYFNSSAGPLALLLLLVMAAGPLLRWRRDHPASLAARLAIPVLVLAAALLLVVAFLRPISLLPLLGLVTAAAVGTASLAPLWRRNLARTPLFTWGMVVAHLGCAVSLAGMAADSAFTKEVLVSLQVGETRRVGPYSVTFRQVSEVPGPNWSALDAELLVQRGSQAPFVMHPQSRTFTDPPMETNESAIATAWDGQLYLVVSAPQDDIHYPIRMWWKPFVTLIWLGGIMMALGGGLALLGRVDRDVFGWRRRLAGRAA